MIIGFTGTRNGMTDEQKAEVTSFLSRTFLDEPWAKGLHGDCIGADADFDAICKELGMEVNIRPCTHKSRAHCDSPALAEPKAPLDRNKDIVNDAHIMVACPPTEHELLRSGTWSTIRYARKKNKTLVVVYPSGKVEA